ncbi:unnamed protein product [Ceutorhynchus assimilis]|uniref:Coiled-coil domain-containing protein 40 n=1 Tax=Ceutorhynchus assimilis TaxID=467358 RepID=A0A9N9MQI0_9CUCU|nr:unnamed protein product [Ceutorhynchus assimilis]
MSTTQKSEQPGNAVLSPDHPLLQTFQAALKEHFLSQINCLKNEIFECETESKKKNEETEQIAVQAHEVQQMVCQHHKSLEELINNVQTIVAARQEVENKLQEKKLTFKKANEELLEHEKLNLDLQNEISSVNLLISQISEWETKIESELTVNQRIAAKARKDNLKFSEEKRKQDVRIYNLMRTIWKLQAEIDTMNMQLKLKETEREELEQTVALGNTNLEALQAEQRCLMHSWSSVVVAIGNRDRIVENLVAEINKVQEETKAKISEMDQIKKLAKKEMNENQRLAIIKARAELDISNCKRLLDEESMKYNEFAKDISELQAIVEQTDSDVHNLSEEVYQKELAISNLTKEVHKINSTKFELEKQLLGTLEVKAANDTVCESLYRQLNSLKEKGKDLEIIMTEAENKLSKSLSQMETEKYNNEGREMNLTEMKKLKNDLEKEADSIEVEKNKYQMALMKKENHITELSDKLEKTLEKMQIKILLSPQEIRLNSLEKQIKETQDKIKDLQIFWMREERNVLSMSQEKQEQIQKLNLLKKENFILQQKNLKISQEIENYKKQEEKTLHNINHLQNKTSILCDQLNKKKNTKINLDKTNYHLQFEFDGKLKEAELEYLKIEADIAEIEEQKIALSKKLIEINRKALEWDKKVKLVNETKAEMRGSQGPSSEIINMKQEIQRMNVIYSQLKKAQEKIVKDLELCVIRRDAIFTVANARQTKSKASEQKLRINNTRKMDDLRNKIKQIQNEIKNIKEKSASVEAQIRLIEHEIQKTKDDISFDENYEKSLRDEIETSKTQRQLKFEILVILQRKLNMYRELAANRQPYLHTKRHNLQAEYEYHKDLNNRLCTILKNLLSDFPNHFHLFTRLYNTVSISKYFGNLEIGSQ